MSIIDLSGQLEVQLRKALEKAKDLEDQNKGAEASEAYFSAAKLMNIIADKAPTLRDRQRQREKALQYFNVAEALKAGKRRVAPSPAQAPQGQGDKAKESGPGEDARHYSDEIASLIHRSKITWDKIGGLEETKREIKFTYGLALAQKPDGVKLAGWRRMLFYGPPGTGKTLLAAATSNGLGATFFNVKASNLLSKYFGESSKLITALFDAARSEADEGFAVIFIDEVESLCLPRGEGSESGAERRMLSTILSEMDGLADKGEDRFVLTISATNTPWDLDDAVLSRFQKRIYIPLPDAEARKAILEIQLLKEGHTLDYPMQEVLRKTEWFSGRDLERLANQAVNIMVEELNGQIPKCVDSGREAIESYKLKIRPLQKKDFDEAFTRIRVDTEKLKKLVERFREFAVSN
jgi:katanin p60 ATPase-containing subunit A1